MNSVISMPNGSYKYAFRAHRLVVLPDYQGLGIGTKLNEFFGEYYYSQGLKYFMRTTHPRLKRHLSNNPNWRASSSNEQLHTNANVNSRSKLKYDDKRIAASYEYVGPDYTTKPHKTIIVDDTDPAPTADELERLKSQYWLTVATGRHKAENETEMLCRALGIRTELLYITGRGVERRVVKYDTPAAVPRTTTKSKTAPVKPKTEKPAFVPIAAPMERMLPEIPLAVPRMTEILPTVPRTERRILWTDIETYSGADLKKTGLHKYMEHPEFGILLLAYAWDDEPVRLIDMTDQFDVDVELPAVIDGLQNPDVLKIAHNNGFERAAYHRQFGAYQPPAEWDDTMIMCAMNGLPMSLDAAGSALNLPEQKIKEGTLLINYFCKPCKPTVANGGRTRNMPWHAPDKWERFKRYAIRDVEVMRTIHKRLARFPVPDWERRVWELDTRINERGVLVDTELAESAIAVDDAFTAEHSAELRKLTGLENPNSVSQLKTWLESVGVFCESLNKETVSTLRGKTADPTVRRVLELRQLLGKTSTTKYTAMTNAACDDHRVRGLLQYYGAGRTGRWAGRLVQVQNLPQNHLHEIATVRELVRERDLETLEWVFPSVPDVLSQLIRTAFVAEPNHTFLVSDYAAIEARVIAYLAGEKWRMDVFADGGDIYCSSASQMFGVPVVKHGVNGHLRQKGKIAELACGYGGGVGALKAFGADKMGLTEDEMQTIVTQWRAASPTIPRFWGDAERAAKNALQNPGRTFALPCGVKYRRDADALRCRLPSGRILSYWGAHIGDHNGRPSVMFWGQNQTTRKWEKTETWGGKLVENIVQAYARDCLAVALLRLDAAGYRIVFHVHDEIIAEAPDGSRWEDMAAIMGEPIEWAPGLLLRGDGYETKFYMKD
jgi:DNA polymerase